MGGASGYRRAVCGHRAEYVTDDFSFGFSGDVVTPVPCVQHGIVSAASWGERPRQRAFHGPESDVSMPGVVWRRRDGTAPDVRSAAGRPWKSTQTRGK